MDLTRSTHSPVIRHPRLSTSRERTSSLDLTSLRLDQLLAAEAAHAHAQPQPSSPHPPSSSDDDDSPTNHLLSPHSSSPLPPPPPPPAPSPSPSARCPPCRPSASCPARPRPFLPRRPPVFPPPALLLLLLRPLLLPPLPLPHALPHRRLQPPSLPLPPHPLFPLSRSSSFGSSSSSRITPRPPSSPTSSHPSPPPPHLSFSSVPSFLSTLRHLLLHHLHHHPLRLSLLLLLLLLPLPPPLPLLHLRLPHGTPPLPPPPLHHPNPQRAPHRLLVGLRHPPRRHPLARHHPRTSSTSTCPPPSRSASASSPSHPSSSPSAATACTAAATGCRTRPPSCRGMRGTCTSRASASMTPHAVLRRRRLAPAAVRRTPPPSPLPVTHAGPASVASDSAYGRVYLPRGFEPSEGDDLWCNEEGFSGNDPGGCRRDSAIFPLGWVRMYDVDMRVPAKAEEVLRDMYGDEWRTPRAKGYKVVVCGWLSGGVGRAAVWGSVAVVYVGVPLLIWAVGQSGSQAEPHHRTSIIHNAHRGGMQKRSGVGWGRGMALL